MQNNSHSWFTTLLWGSQKQNPTVLLSVMQNSCKQKVDSQDTCLRTYSIFFLLQLQVGPIYIKERTWHFVTVGCLLTDYLMYILWCTMSYNTSLTINYFNHILLFNQILLYLFVFWPPTSQKCTSVCVLFSKWRILLCSGAFNAAWSSTSRLYERLFKWPTESFQQYKLF